MKLLEGETVDQTSDNVKFSREFKTGKSASVGVHSLTWSLSSLLFDKSLLTKFIWSKTSWSSETWVSTVSILVVSLVPFSVFEHEFSLSLFEVSDSLDSDNSSESLLDSESSVSLSSLSLLPTRSWNDRIGASIWPSFSLATILETQKNVKIAKRNQTFIPIPRRGFQLIQV